MNAINIFFDPSLCFSADAALLARIEKAQREQSVGEKTEGERQIPSNKND